MLHSPRQLLLAGVALAALASQLLSPPEAAAMRSEKLGPGLCKTTGGGRFVAIPGFPGEQIDRRLLRDIRWMRRNYRIFITDGYSTAPYHAPNGEHPIGLALDIVPYRAKGGNWKLINRLARLAEPRQNESRPPWRWVGYNGDPGHGRGHHLHLSYMHSPTQPRVPARIVYTYRCPKPPTTTSSPSTEPSEPSGGVAAPMSASASGLAPASLFAELAPAVPEAGGASFGDRR